MYGFGLASVAWAGRGQHAGFAAPTARAAGNQLPGITGYFGPPSRPGPKVQGQAGGQLGFNDGLPSVDPRAPLVSPVPRSSLAGAWDEGQVLGASGAPFGYGAGAPRGWAGRIGRTWGDPLPGGPETHQSFRRYGIQGFSDKLTVKDRHVYWDAGKQKTGIEGFPPAGSPNTYNNPLQDPPRPDLRAVNRTVSYQKGSDKSRNQDDLTRGYTWLGEQGSGWTPVSGGVPGLYQPYGTRGGVPYPVVSPVEQGQPGDGPRLVWAGPPHGLHSTTPWKGGEQIISRFMSTPQTRPVRIDRPSNSPQAGQSYSQTVRPQGAPRVQPGTGQARQMPGGRYPLGRKWGGRNPKGKFGS